MQPQLFSSFWYGQALTPYEVLCIKSFLNHGHKFRLYTYDEMKVPAGTELCDANSVLPREEIFFYSSGPGAGSVAAFANKFRYALLAKDGGWWVDMDIICITDDFPSPDMFFAYEEGTRINNGILHFPKNSPIMAACLDGAAASGRDLVWGQTGPKLLTEVLEQHKISEQARPIHLCYALEWHQYLYFWDPVLRPYVDEAVKDSIVVHLWHEMVRRIGLNKQKPPPPGSYLDYLCKKHEIEFSLKPMRAFDIHMLQHFIRWRGRFVDRLEGRQPWLKFNF